ncbi:MAG TPA: prolyl oligopeptidase family serine peptidase [Bacteroidales bacterium]|nr:prolyl oligopeptidase family serine peptidase [Bacteroidales bacterium]
MKAFVILVLSFLLVQIFPLPASGNPEKRPLTHDDYSSWNTLAGQVLSADGQWIVYEVNPQQGDGKLIIHHIVSGNEVVVPRGHSASISPGNRFAVFYIRPPHEIVRQARLDRKKPDQMPVDSLGIFYFDNLHLAKLPGPVTYAMPMELSDWFVYHVERAERRGQSGQQGEPGGVDGIALMDTLRTENESDDRKKLFIYNPVSGVKHFLENVDAYLISPFGNLVAGIVEKKQGDTLEVKQVVTLGTATMNQQIIDTRPGEIQSLVVDRAGEQLAWLHTADTGKVRNYSLWTWEAKRNRLTHAVTSQTGGMPEGFGPSQHRRPFFSRNGLRLFLGTAPIPSEEPTDTLLPDERFSVDIWHWQDPLLQSQQLHNLSRDRNRTFLGVYHLRQQRFVQLATPEMPDVSLDLHNDLLIALGSSNLPYLWESAWIGGAARDLFIVDVETGQTRPILQRVTSVSNLSPGGNFVTWFDPEQKHWFSYNIRNRQIINLTQNIPVAFYNQEQDLPALAGPYGFGGWTENDEYLLLNDRFDVWKIEPTGRQIPEMLTQGHGRKNHIRFRVQDLDPRDQHVTLNDLIFFNAFNIQNKQSGFFALQNGQFRQLIMEDAAFSLLQKASNAERFTWRQGTFADFPDIYTGIGGFDEITRVSNANPQQENYLWGSVKLVEWYDFNNRPVQGLLYLPGNFDSLKKYPMVVYFYERLSDGLHQHFIPAPSRSTINRTFFTSNGYVVFVPDITYTEGFPGASAYNAIVSGTNAMLERYPFIDRENLGIQGQSWGGYQVAYLITRTNMFGAAMAGAPVSNMISAYNAIRWESGRSRQFQYEMTQSRIGGSLWEKKELYIENSPIFFADRIETPLLIMHNDDDGAVHYFQGIELFLAMRRLSRPVWMLVYNQEEHNLTKWPNRVDLSIRMQQFFDYFLKDAPAPRWLKYGIPALEKGRIIGYELIE